MPPAEPMRNRVEQNRVEEDLRTGRPVLEREDLAGPQIEIEIPSSKGDVAAASPAAPPADLSDAPSPGTESDAGRTSEKLRHIEFDEETRMRAAELLGGAFEAAAAIGLRDEINDEEALRIAGQQPRYRAVGAPIHQDVIEHAPADVPFPAIEHARERGTDLVLIDQRPVPPEPQTLPALLGALPAHLDRTIEWHNVRNVPGYFVNIIRALGRSTLRSFPCFAEHERKERAGGVGDPLATVGILAHFEGVGSPQNFSEKRELDLMADWIRKNGSIVEATQLEFPGAFPGYRPQIVLAVTADESFLLVNEKRAEGAPVDAIYVYRWKGGAGPYLINGRLDTSRIAPRAADRVRLVGPGAPPQARALPAGDPHAGPPRRVAPAAGDLMPDNSAAAAPSAADDRRRRRALLSGLPEASDRTQGAGADGARQLRDAGFMPHSNQDGPGLRWTSPAGEILHVTPPKGVKFPDATSFHLQISAPGAPMEAREGLSVSDVLAEQADRRPAPAP